MLYKDVVYEIIGAAMEVYNILGPGFLEAVYQETLEMELTDRGIPFDSHPQVAIYFKDRKLDKEYTADLMCFEQIIVELKAVDCLVVSYQAQLLNYLKGTHKDLGLLINFGNEHKLEWKRMVL